MAEMRRTLKIDRYTSLTWRRRPLAQEEVYLKSQKKRQERGGENGRKTSPTSDKKVQGRNMSTNYKIN